MTETIAIPRSWRRDKIERNIEICRLYISRDHTTEQIARYFKLTPRNVQYIAKAGGVVRTQADANRVATRLKSPHRISQRRTGSRRP